MNLWLQVWNFSLGPLYWQLFGALVCAIFAVAYFGVARLTRRAPNQMIGLVVFFLVAVPFAVWLISGFLTTTGSPPNRRLAMVLFAAIFSLLSGLVLSVVNLTWVLLRSNKPPNSR